MRRLSLNGWFSIGSFTAGVLLGSAAMSYLMLTSSPVPIGATAIALAVAASPVCILLLLIARLVPGLGVMVAPMLFLGGIAVPLDLGFSCLLGWVDHLTLQLALAGLSVFSVITLLGMVNKMRLTFIEHSTQSSGMSLATLDPKIPGAPFQ